MKTISILNRKKACTSLLSILVLFTYGMQCPPNSSPDKKQEIDIALQKDLAQEDLTIINNYQSFNNYLKGYLSENKILKTLESNTISTYYKEGERRSLEFSTINSIKDSILLYGRAVVDASKNKESFDPADRLASQQSQGGLYANKRLLDEHGVEYIQLITKSLFGALFFSRAYEITQELKKSQSGLIELKINRLPILFGATETMQPRKDKASLAAIYTLLGSGTTSTADNQSVEVNQNSVWEKMKGSLTKAKNTSLSPGDRKEAVSELIKQWERGIVGGAVVYYAFRSYENLLKTDEVSKADALHWLSEITGFLYGLRANAEIGRTIAKTAEIDKILEWIGTPYNGTKELYSFLTIDNKKEVLTGGELEVDNVIDSSAPDNVVKLLKNIYGFTSQEISLFKR